MARTLLPVTTMVRAGSRVSPDSDMTVGDAANGMYFSNAGLVFLVAYNSHDSIAYTITPIIALAPDGVSVVSPPRSLGPLEIWVFRPLDATNYNQADGTVNLDIQNAAVKLMAFKVVV